MNASKSGGYFVLVVVLVKPRVKERTVKRRVCEIKTKIFSKRTEQDARQKLKLARIVEIHLVGDFHREESGYHVHGRCHYNKIEKRELDRAPLEFVPGQRVAFPWPWLLDRLVLLKKWKLMVVNKAKQQISCT